MKKILLGNIVLCTIFLISAQLQEPAVQLPQLSYGIQGTFNLPPVLEATQLNQLDATQKKHSDELMVDLLINLAQVEFYSLPSMKQFIIEALKQLRANMLFFQRAALDKLLDEQEGLLSKLSELYTPNPGQSLDKFLLQSYTELRKKKNSTFYRTLHNLVSDCFFDVNELNNESLIAAFLQLGASAIVTQRKKISTISTAQAKKSDTVFMNVFKKYQKDLQSQRVTGLRELSYELNCLRLLPSFLKFTEYMLYPIEKNVLQGEAIIPLIPFVRNIDQFLPIKTGFAASQQLAAQTRRFLFNNDVWKTSINNDIWKAAFEYEFARNRPITAKISLESFVAQELPKIKNLSQLGKFFKQIEENYKIELGPQSDKLAELRTTILNNQSNINIQEILDFLSNITLKSAPEIFVTFLTTIQDDIALITIIRNTFTENETTGQDFCKELLRKTTNYPAIQKKLINLYRTPHSLFLAIQNEFKNREMKYNLDEQQFYFKVKPCGMLIRVLEFFIREVDKNSALARNNWQMLRQSLECMNNPELCLSSNGKYFKIYQTIHNALYPREKAKSAVAERVEQGKTATIQLAPELFNFYIENNTLKPSTFVPSLTVYKDAEDPHAWGIYDAKLDALLTALNDKNIEQIIAQVRAFVKQTEIISTDKEPFTTFAQNLEKALRITINQLPK